jgi:hypothetical protein
MAAEKRGNSGCIQMYTINSLCRNFSLGKRRTTLKGTDDDAPKTGIDANEA